MPLILFIRHGENDYTKNRRLAGRLPGVHLNERGRAQAQAIADKLASKPIKAIYASPLERAMETAAPIAQALGLEIIPRQGLIEIDCGDWQGKTLKSLERLKLWQVVQTAPSRARFPNGETFFEAQYRVVKEIEELCHNHTAEDALICVSHSDIIKLAVAHFIGLSLDHFQRLQVTTGSISALHISENRGILLSLNDGASLFQEKK